MLLLLLALAVLFIVVATTRFRLHPFLALLLAAGAFGLCSPLKPSEVITSIKDGFGATVGGVGIVIIAGTIIGVFLERSGGAFALADAILRRVGRSRVPAAMAITGYITSIPVFCDSGFVIFAPLNRALTRRAGLSLAGTAIALALGLLISHTLIPPTPGPVAAIVTLGADIGLVLCIAVPVSLVVLAAAWIWATRIAARTWIDPEPQLDDAGIEARLADAPPAGRAFLPIVVPLLLIVLKSAASYPSHPLGTGLLAAVLGFVGDPSVALLVGVALALLLPRRLERQMLSQSGWVGEGILAAATIILITGAGGAFGRVLLNSGLARSLGDSLASTGLGLWLPFAAAAAIRAAQGSATVALITASSIVAPLLASLGLDSDIGRALAVVSTGAGALFASHANDSYFWVVTQLSGMSPGSGYRLYTAATCLLSILAGVLVWLAGLMVQ